MNRYMHVANGQSKRLVTSSMLVIETAGKIGGNYQNLTSEMS